MPHIYTIGETVFDIIFKNMKPIDAKCGGAMLNTAVSLGRLNMPVSFISEYATDKIGETIDAFLLENHVDASYIHKFEGTSPIALAYLDDNNNATYNFHRHYPTDRLNIDFPTLKQGDSLLFGSSFAFNKEIRAKLITLLNQAKQAGAIIVYDPNYRKAHAHEFETILPMILENIAFADIIRASDEDLQNIFKCNTSAEAYVKLLTLGCSTLIYTAAGKNAEIITPTYTNSFTVPDIQPISTIGAGDTFNAGLLFSLYQMKITKENIVNLTPTNWNSTIETAITCSIDVCMSYENYISVDLARKIKK